MRARLRSLGGSRRQELPERDSGGRAVRGRERGLGVGGGRGLTLGVGKVALSWGLGSCGSESQFRDGGVEEGPRQGARSLRRGNCRGLSAVCCACLILYVNAFAPIIRRL